YHYVDGYFDDERDGFGEVEHDLESTVDRIIEYMRNGCALKPLYRERIDNFFAFNDQNNCQRVYEKIRALDD
ncbi:MAG: CDP-glycerol glycerophosphotransferase family protein, partial [Clostridiales bacterium]|nr:CDP-glycerol glycerophosphotransferase family protein [Clostridiales bacterium]